MTATALSKALSNIVTTMNTINIRTKASMKMGDRSFETESSEKWFLQENGKVLVVKQSSEFFGNKRNLTLFYNKE